MKFMYKYLMFENEESKRILNIYRETEFGVEIESCFITDITSGESNFKRTLDGSYFGERYIKYIKHYDKMSHKLIPSKTTGSGENNKKFESLKKLNPRKVKFGWCEKQGFRYQGRIL